MAITALVLLLCISYIAVGGIVFYVIKLTKDLQVSSGSDTTRPQLTDTAGNTLHVMSTTSTVTTSQLSSLDSDNVFENLLSASLDIGGTPVTLKVAGFARSKGSVMLFTTSPAIPIVVLTGTELAPGPGVSDSTTTALFAANITSSGSRRSFVSAGSGYFMCPAGTYYATANSRCNICSPGKYTSCPNAATFSTNCLATSVEACTWIEAGYYASKLIYSASSAWFSTSDVVTYPAAGAQAIAACGFGTYRADRAAQNFCSGCSTKPGYHCGMAATSAAGSLCPAGYYCLGGAVTSAPPACTGGSGSYCPAGSSSSAGSVCPAHKYCAGGSAAPVAACVADPGYYCVSPSSTTATLCSEGYYCTGGAQATRSTCSTLPGYYCGIAATSSAGSICPAGYYCVGGAVTSAPPACTGGSGRYCPQGSSSASGSSCPAGYTCAGGSAAPVLWPLCQAAPGYYCASTYATTTTICPAGSYCAGMFAPPVQCTDLGVGRYCPAGTSSSLGAYCPVGSFCDGTGAIVSCTAGPNKYCPGGVETNPAISAAGVYCSRYSASDSAEGVPNPYYFGSTFVCKGGSTAPIPAVCPAGYTSIGGPGRWWSAEEKANKLINASSVCKPCTIDAGCYHGTHPLGSYHPTKTPAYGGSGTTDASLSVALGYPAAKTNTVFPTAAGLCQNGLTRVGVVGGYMCVPCPAGYLCPANDAAKALGSIPVPCDGVNYCGMGYSTYFQTGSGLTGICPEGTYTLSTTYLGNPLKACANCPAGTYSTYGSSACTACAAGTMSAPGSSSCALTAATCPPGTYASVADRACFPCADGYFNGWFGQTKCLIASSGSFAFSSGGKLPAELWAPLRGSAQAIPCPAGSYADQYGMSLCKSCPANTYSQYPAGNFACAPCAQGLTVAEGMGKSSADCKA